VDDGNRGMVQPGKGPGFFAEPFAGGFVANGTSRENLDGDIAVKVLIVRTIDLPHAALTDLVEDAVMPQRAAH
jgi:hypothetical protein